MEKWNKNVGNRCNRGARISLRSNPLSLLTLFAFFLLLLVPVLPSRAHPLKMAYTSVKYNPQEQVFEVSHRVFQDDFELTLNERYGHRGANVYEEQRSQAVQEVVNRFFARNFALKVNGRSLRMNYKQTEQKHQMGIIVHYQTERVVLDHVETITVENTILMEQFEEQVNMFHINIYGELKRTLKFEQDHTQETLEVEL